MTTTPDDANAATRPPLCLIGLRGSGKSALGARLAEATGGTFIDLDEATCRRLGVDSVTAAFERHGEEPFRRAELETLRDLGARLEPGTVLALGGGTPCSESGRELVEHLKRGGVVIAWLDAPDSALASRLARGTDRPRLRGASIEEEIATLRAERQRTYRRLADLRVDTDAFTMDGAVRSVLSWCRDRIDEGR
ncbi:MAG: shikimate kinase [Phycisphaerales bacterium]